MDQPRFLVGQMLLSLPGIGDPRFEQAVIAMCVHDEQGAFGLMVNQVIDGISARDVMEQLEVDPGETPDVPVYAGGPVEPGRGFVLHSPDYEGESTICVSRGTGPVRWGLTSTLDILGDIAAGKGPAQWLLALGYTGWGAGQLDGEMTRHGWQTAPGNDDLVWALPPADRWRAAYAGLGIAVAKLSATAGRA